MLKQSERQRDRADITCNECGAIVRTVRPRKACW